MCYTYVDIKKELWFFSKYFLFSQIKKILVKIARYSFIIDRYGSGTLIVCNEYSFTSSVMKEYCKAVGVKLGIVMHGEKVFSLNDSFFSFEKCYV